MAETITTPGTPTGVASSPVNTAVTFTTTGSTSSLGHALEYQWTTTVEATPLVLVVSAWSTSLTITYTYTDSGRRWLVVQARCAAHTTIKSDASADVAVMVYQEEVPSVAADRETVALAHTIETVAA